MKELCDALAATTEDRDRLADEGTRAIDKVSSLQSRIQDIASNLDSETNTRTAAETYVSQLEGFKGGCSH